MIQLLLAYVNIMSQSVTVDTIIITKIYLNKHIEAVKRANNTTNHLQNNTYKIYITNLTSSSLIIAEL